MCFVPVIQLSYIEPCNLMLQLVRAIAVIRNVICAVDQNLHVQFARLVSLSTLLMQRIDYTYFQMLARTERIF